MKKANQMQIEQTKDIKCVCGFVFNLGHDIRCPRCLKWYKETIINELCNYLKSNKEICWDIDDCNDCMNINDENTLCSKKIIDKIELIKELNKTKN